MTSCVQIVIGDGPEVHISAGEPRVGIMDKLDRDSLVDLHEQLSGVLRAQIRRGELTGRIPSIKHLSQQYEVSVKTVERSLNTLRDEGLIAARLGRGFFVVPR